MATRWDETWHRLNEWTSGQGPSERLAAQVLFEDGFTELDPSHPLGGRDGKKDAIAWRSNEKWVMAVYFPRGQKPFAEIKEKLVSDYAGVATNNAAALAFVTNQEISLGERSELKKSVPGKLEIFHLERITAILDKPSMRSVRAQFLAISEAETSPASKPIFARTISSLLPNSLVGRLEELAKVSAFLDSSPIESAAFSTLVIAGMPGVGKTALAVRAASSAVSQGLFPGGAITVDFNGYAANVNGRVSPQQVLSSVLFSLGYSAKESEPSTLFVRLQTLLAELDASGRRVLLFFDNVSQASQIEPLLVSSTAHRIIITSRNAIAPRLGSTEQLALIPLSTGEGVKLITQAAQYSSIFERQKYEGAATGLEKLATICAGLPIALRLVGEILRNEEHLSPDELAAELSAKSTRLAGLEFEDAAVRAEFEGSYRRLSDAAAKCFRYISVHPGQEFSVDSMAAILDSEKLEVRRSFRALDGSHLVSRAAADKPTWTMHDLLRLYSAELFGLMDGSAAAALALSSLYEYYFETAEQANEWLNANSATGERAAFQGLPEARSWMSTEVSGIVASVEEAVRTSNHIDAFRLAITVGTYLDIIRDKASCLAMAETALSAARALEDDDKEAGALNNVGLALNSMQRFSEAKSIFIEASRKYRKLGNKSGEATVLLGLCDVLRAEGHLQETVGPLKRAVRLNMECGDVRGAGFAMTNLGITLRESNQFREAIEVLLAALKVHEETKAQRAEASTLVHLGTALTQVRDYAEGMSYLFRARDYAVSSGDVVGLTAACVNIGNVYRIQGDYEAAKEQYLYAVQACEEADDDTSLALALWNLIKLSEEIRDVRAASQYKSRLLSIPQSDLPYQVKSILSKGI